MGECSDNLRYRAKTDHDSPKVRGRWENTTLDLAQKVYLINSPSYTISDNSRWEMDVPVFSISWLIPLVGVAMGCQVQAELAKAVDLDGKCRI